MNKVGKEKVRDITDKIVDRNDSDMNKAYKIYEWVRSNMKEVYKGSLLEYYIVFKFRDNLPEICFRLTSSKYPYIPIFTRCGACLEYSLAYRDLAYESGLEVRSVHDKGEDHNWDEVYINGRWIVVDPSWLGFNISRTDVKDVKGNISYIYAEYPNGTQVDITDLYTKTYTLEFHILDAEMLKDRYAEIQLISKNPNSISIPFKTILISGENNIYFVKLGEGNYKIRLTYEENPIITRYYEKDIIVNKNLELNMKISEAKNFRFIPMIYYIIYLLLGIVIIYIGFSFSQKRSIL